MHPLVSDRISCSQREHRKSFKGVKRDAEEISGTAPGRGGMEIAVRQLDEFYKWRF